MLKQVIANTEQAASFAAAGNRFQSTLLTRRQVAGLLGVCTHSVQRLTRKGVLPALIFNKRLIRYRPETVEAFIAQAKVG